MAFSSTLKKFRDYLPEIEKEGEWISQHELSCLTGIDVRTIRQLRKQGDLASDVAQQNDIWILVESIRKYCNRDEFTWLRRAWTFEK